MRKILLALALSLALSLSAYAADGIDYERANQNSYQFSIGNFHWIQDENQNWKFINNRNEVKVNKFFDMNGDIYEADSNGIIYTSKFNEKGEYYDENGRLVNRSSDYLSHTDFISKAEQYENGTPINFSSVDELLSFLDSYHTQYQLYNQDSIDSYWIIRNNGATLYPKKAKYDREDTKKRIIEKFGIPTGDDPYDIILDACRKVQDKMEYDSNYIMSTMMESVDGGRGVCWQYAKITSVLLDAAGIYNEKVIGKMYPYGSESFDHMWLRCKVEGKWIYCDPVNAKGSDESYANINYSDYINQYVTNAGINQRNEI